VHAVLLVVRYSTVQTLANPAPPSLRFIACCTSTVAGQEGGEGGGGYDIGIYITVLVLYDTGDFMGKEG